MKNALILAAVAALSACGGGGGGDNTVQGSAEGLYNGTTNTGRTVTGIVLDDGSYYVLYSVVNNPALIAGVVQGTGASSNGSFSSSNAKDVNLEGSGVLSASISASYRPKSSLNGSISYSSSQSPSFTSTYNANYELTPSLAAIVGTYSGTSGMPAGSENATITVSTNGTFSGSGASGCSFTGTIAPRTKGNAYNASLTFGGAPCLLANVTVTGGAYFDAPTKRLYAVGLTAARDNGIIFVGTKP